MTVYNKFHCYVQDLHEGKHNFQQDSIKLALTGTLPSASDSFFSDIDEIAETGGYVTGGFLIEVLSSAQVNGVYTLKLQNTSFIATGDLEPFRYIVAYNSSNTEKNLICWFDHGGVISMKADESYFFNFDEDEGLFTVS